MSMANFSVSTQSHPLLTNFGPKVASMKEFFVFLSSSAFVITFTPSNNLFAFVNVLEIVSVPKSFIAENASIDFTTTLVVHNSLNVITAPFIYSRQRNAFLNRVEIMKMNNSMRSLCGVTNVEYSSNVPSRKNVGFIVGVGVAVLVVVVVVALLYWVHKTRNVESLFNGATTNVASNFGHRIPLAAVLVATNNFDESLVVRIGGFGIVFKVTLSDGIIVAVKRGTPASQQGQTEFQTKIEKLSQLRH
ncbi:hypothetical protein LguiB_001558 [Lonicera macranthoides]